jgi:transposase-like protein
MSQKQSIRNGQHVEQTEVAPKAKRRQYTNEYKLRILDEIDHSTDPAGIGSILRREGLYSQIISKWRQQRADGKLDAQRSERRGPKPHPEAKELARLKHENERLRKRLERAELIIDVQKKISQILGVDENQMDE